MPRTIVVGYDGSEHGEDALALARRLAQPAAAKLVVACAFPEDPLGGAGAAAGVGAELRDDAERQLAHARELLGLDGRVDYRAVAGRAPSAVLHEIAEESGAEAIVVGASHHGTALRALSGGGTPEHVLDHAPCPVAVAPEGFAQRGGALRRVTVAFDDSPEAALALATAARLARDAGVPLRLATAVNVAALSAYPPLDLTSYEQLAALAREEAGRRLEAAAAPLGDLPVERAVLEGDPVDALVEDAGPDDLLVAGSGAKGALRRVLLGSVSRKLLHAAPCPVLVVPRGGDG